MRKLFSSATVALLGAAVLGGCTTMGVGEGSLARHGQPGEPVLFTWHSKDNGQQGTMTAALPDATYQGRFFQITSQTQRNTLAPLWIGWDDGWGDWPYWGGPNAYGYDGTQFITHYSGKVVATLTDTEGDRMRCRFVLSSPASGMVGGGQGECQIAGGRKINAMFAPQ
jgi:hypothetical protein